MDTRDTEVARAMSSLRKRARSSSRARRQLGRILFAARSVAGLSMREVMEQCGPAESTVLHVEHGERVPIKATMFAMLEIYRQYCEIGVFNDRIWVSPR